MKSDIMGGTDAPAVDPEVAAKESRMEKLHEEFAKNKDNIGSSGDGRSGLEGFHRCYNRICDDYRKDLPIGVDCQCKRGRVRAPGAGASQLF